DQATTPGAVGVVVESGKWDGVCVDHYSTEQPFQQFIPVQAMVGSNGIENGCQSTDPQRIMAGDSHMVVSPVALGQTHVTSGLAGNRIVQPRQPFGQFRAGKIARQLHAAITS